ncbi:MAG: hypothetical protein CO113_10755 [Elusimicrobia bacterium CG_4_9_14_3_um_filter_62_55]|nr:MAG: hypothetical protein COR54_14080 [Elusimicrobia bacterium CG22_combo_CG10-13_8_21_14_all_63_91]PJA17240.1 MAG: hypothetical protein COX66_05280 [Elusimicrobia bacterium CG_4_10_14_0_2_um_filter_63_34]PJB25052.1 MAG: hypothetical protein CO113_10755 [Elusimicrobia bacterium CG_4_9_14_3_um_filter_62_55]
MIKRQTLKKPAQQGQVYQLKVALDEITPPIWRRLVVPSDINLFKLHEIIQVAMGWTNSHLHQFIVGRTFYGIPDDEIEGAIEIKDERKHTLSQIAKKKGAKVVYEYDMGDSWEHHIVVEEVLEQGGKTGHPSCLDGARACPPEDVGSTPGYYNFLAAIKDPKHPEHKIMIEWIERPFDPEAFSVDDVNEDLIDLRKRGLPSVEDF